MKGKKINYEDIRECLLDDGFKCIDMIQQGDEVFQKGNIKFAVYEVDEDESF